MASDVLPEEQQALKAMRTTLQVLHDRALLSKMMLQGYATEIVLERLVKEARMSGYTYTQKTLTTDLTAIRKKMKDQVSQNTKDYLGVLLARINLERSEIWAEIDHLRGDAPDLSTERREILVNVLDDEKKIKRDAKGEPMTQPVAGHVRVISKQRGTRTGIAALFERLAELTRQEMDLLGLRQPQRERHEMDDDVVFEPKPKSINYGDVNAILEEWASGRLNEPMEIIEAEMVSAGD